MYLLKQSSESDIALDLSGNYKHYDNVGNDLKLETTNHIISSPTANKINLNGGLQPAPQKEPPASQKEEVTAAEDEKDQDDILCKFMFPF